MRGLPRSARFDIAGLQFTVIHGGAGVDNRFVFASQVDLQRAEADRAGGDIVIAGHAGLPFLSRMDRGRLWFNAGVIGMPANDGTPDGWYGMMAPDAGGVRCSLHRLSYDFAGAAAAMRRFGHADCYARTLIDGLWPSLDILPDAERRASGRRLVARKVSVSALVAA
jgi:hypothetical protein